MSRRLSPTSPSRIIHVFTAAITGVLYFLITSHWPDLVKDVVTTFGTVGFFVAVYGVLFTILEVLRTQAAAALAAETARQTANRIEALYDARDAATCLILIENALERLHEERSLSPSQLARIVTLYTAEFSSFFNQEVSIHRDRAAMVKNFMYSHNQQQSQKVSKANRLSAALLEMSMDLALSQTLRAHEEPAL